MSYKETSYIAKSVDDNGFAQYDEEEHKVWNTLMTRQVEIIKGRACNEYHQGLAQLNLSPEKIPQCPDISNVLYDATGWRLEPVPALIPFEKFFYLLANRRFPAATFIRRQEELDYLQEPDIFHEVFGHCPLLTNSAYADFTHNYGKLALQANKADRVLLARLYWFTIEFGLIRQNNDVRIYGGGILSSANETLYCLENHAVMHKPFDVLDVLRTPYRINIMQPVYFILESFDVLYELIESDLICLIHEARKLGEHAPAYAT